MAKHHRSRRQHRRGRRGRGFIGDMVKDVIGTPARVVQELMMKNKKKKKGGSFVSWINDHLTKPMAKAIYGKGSGTHHRKQQRRRRR